ncbi:hypothetical protein TNCT_77331 [Trichonephila clavata]|uniref:Uncharacterized protein n=1 Tax=Trichonephila clavata TaxID=2740835 RepID=A0A8X6HYJ6_TRICU|nr:hypothetical protein TNCT_77331 [Trichonephila clavata]
MTTKSHHVHFLRVADQNVCGNYSRATVQHYLAPVDFFFFPRIKITQKGTRHGMLDMEPDCSFFSRRGCNRNFFMESDAALTTARR